MANRRNLLGITSLLVALGGCATAAGEPPPPVPIEAVVPLPETSLYQLDLSLETQAGERVKLADFRGKPVLVSMFYANCPMACPVLIEDIRRLEQRLSPEERANLKVLLISLDPARDTPELMRDVAQRHDLDLSRWTLARTTPEQVRTVATTLSIRYRDLKNGEMNHSSILTLLDAEGVRAFQLEGLESDPQRLIDAIRAQ